MIVSSISIVRLQSGGLTYTHGLTARVELTPFRNSFLNAPRPFKLGMFEALSNQYRLAEIEHNRT